VSARETPLDVAARGAHPTKSLSAGGFASAPRRRPGRPQFAPEKMDELTGTAMSWVTGSFGWLFVLMSGAFVLFSGYLALSRYGNIKLGPDDAVPQFSPFSWVSVLLWPVA
jgi:BCCT, betaine/carnitine/choline family transporter